MLGLCELKICIVFRTCTFLFYSDKHSNCCHYKNLCIMNNNRKQFSVYTYLPPFEVVGTTIYYILYTRGSFLTSSMFLQNHLH